MPRYRQKPVEIDAHQWFKNGDHPKDGPADREGKVVRYFRRPDVRGDAPCIECREPMNAHGWLDTLEARPVTREDGSVGWLMVHHSLDSREASEDQ